MKILVLVIVIILLIVDAILALFLICAPLYCKFGLFKWFYHDILEWHEPDNSPQWSDGMSSHAICKYCGREIMQDSQGNWF